MSRTRIWNVVSWAPFLTLGAVACGGAVAVHERPAEAGAGEVTQPPPAPGSFLPRSTGCGETESGGVALFVRDDGAEIVDAAGRALSTTEFASSTRSTFVASAGGHAIAAWHTQTDPAGYGTTTLLRVFSDGRWVPVPLDASIAKNASVNVAGVSTSGWIYLSAFSKASQWSHWLVSPENQVAALGAEEAVTGPTEDGDIVTCSYSAGVVSSCRLRSGRTGAETDLGDVASSYGLVASGRLLVMPRVDTEARWGGLSWWENGVAQPRVPLPMAWDGEHQGYIQVKQVTANGWVLAQVQQAWVRVHLVSGRVDTLGEQPHRILDDGTVLGLEVHEQRDAPTPGSDSLRKLSIRSAGVGQATWGAWSSTKLSAPDFGVGFSLHTSQQGDATLAVSAGIGYGIFLGEAMVRSDKGERVLGDLLGYNGDPRHPGEAATLRSNGECVAALLEDDGWDFDPRTTRAALIPTDPAKVAVSKSGHYRGVAWLK